MAGWLFPIFFKFSHSRTAASSINVVIQMRTNVSHMFTAMYPRLVWRRKTTGRPVSGYSQWSGYAPRTNRSRGKPPRCGIGIWYTESPWLCCEARQSASFTTGAPPGEAFQFDWSTEYTFIGGLRRRVELAHTKLCASRALWLGVWAEEGKFPMASLEV